MPRSAPRDKTALDIRGAMLKLRVMGREIKLNGGEITLLKTIGLSGTQVAGKQLIDKLEEMESAEFLDTLAGLIDMSYVLANKVNIRTIEDVERAIFRVNPAHSKDLREAINPGRNRDKDRARRQRRS